MSPATARRWLVGVLALAGIEWIASAVVYRSRIADEDWTEIEAALEPELPVYVATPWLDPLARMELDAVAELDHVARPDLRGQARFHTIGLGDAWSDDLEADLEDLPRPVLEATTEAGALTLSTWSLAVAPRVDDLLAHADAIEIEADGERCRGRSSGSTRDCGDRGSGKQPVGVDTVEVDYRPRRCMAIDVADGRAVTLRVPEFGFGDVLRGHVGVDDFNARLRSDASLTLEARADGRVLARWTFTDAQGWARFAVATPPGSGTLELVAIPSVRGTWGRNGYGHAPPHRFCIEARSFDEGGA